MQLMWLGKGESQGDQMMVCAALRAVAAVVRG